MCTKILAIDDSRTIRELLRIALEAEDFSFECGVDGEHGIQKFTEFNPDLVITDINMPKMNGFEVIKTLRGEKIQTTIPIIVLTTEFSDEMKAKAKSSGATAWIVKPFDDKNLVSVIRRLVG